MQAMIWRSLAKQNEFKTVYERGVKKVGRLLVVYLYSADDSARAVVASRKVGNAVKRNRAKRLLREAFRNGSLGNADGLTTIRERYFPVTDGDNSDRSTTEGLWVVLVARRNILEAKAGQVRDELDSLLSEA